MARSIVDQTNGFRATQGLAKTEPDPRLAEAARSFAAYMAATDRYAHDADGSSPAARAQTHGYEFCALSENIASMLSSRGLSTDALARGLADGWKRSPGHRKNMLDGNMIDIGVAIAQSARSKRYYAVQMFGRPRSKMIEFSVVNASPRDLHYDVGGESFTIGPRVRQTHRQCSAAPVTIGAGAQAIRVDPSNGGRYTVEGFGAEGFRLRRD